MKVNFAHLCDYAFLTLDGKIGLIGLFNRVNAQRLPHILPQSFLAFEIELDYTDVGKEFEVRIECVDEDGNKVFGAQSKIGTTPTERPKPADRPKFPQVVGFQNLVFNRAGAHNINIFLDSNIQNRVEFDVAVTGNPPTPLVGGPASPLSPPPSP